MKKQILSEEEVKNILDLYQNKKYGVQTIEKTLGISPKVVKRILIENNVEIRGRKAQAQFKKSQYYINPDIFKGDTANSCYILGLYAADGNVAEKDNRITIEFQGNDVDFLKDINERYIKSERPVRVYERAEKENREYCELYFYSKGLKEDLLKHNIVPRKTYSDDFIFSRQIKNEYIKDYIRGYFDGNGSCKMTGYSPTFQIDTPSKDIAEYIKKYFLNCNIMGNITKRQYKNVVVHRYYCYGKEKLQKIYSLLYDNAELFLPRKKEKIESLLK